MSKLINTLKRWLGIVSPSEEYSYHVLKDLENRLSSPCIKCDICSGTKNGRICLERKCKHIEK